MTDRQHFYDRLARLDREAAEADMVFTAFGPSHSREVARNRRLSRILERHDLAREAMGKGYKPRAAFKMTPVISYLGAFAMGALALVIARFLRFQIEGASGQIAAPDIEMVLDVVLAISVAFLLREAMSLSAVKRMGAQFAGILLAVVTLHNAVHRMPDTFAQVFSRDWVQSVTTTTEPNSLYFRGHSFAI